MEEENNEEEFEEEIVDDEVDEPDLDTEPVEVEGSNRNELSISLGINQSIALSSSDLPMDVLISYFETIANELFDKKIGLTKPKKKNSSGYIS